jgi:hypothetical protein
MRSTPYSSILTQVYSLLNLAAADVTAADEVKIRAFIERRAREAFQKYWWDATMAIEERWFRAFYAAGTAYTVGTEVYYPGPRGYYQALATTTGNAPATLSGTSWTTATAYWSAIGENYSGADWAASTVYALADTVRNLDDGLFYRCHTAHTSGATFDATKWGLLTEWLPYISLDQTGKTAIGLVRGVFLDNPARVSDPRRLKFLLGPSGIHLLDNISVSAYVWFQKLPPHLSGPDFNAAATYAAGDYVYYSSTTQGFEGDFWKCLATTSAGEDPEDAPTKWQKQEVPEHLRDAIAHAVYSDYLRPAGKDAAVPLEDTAGGQFLLAELMKATAMQSQSSRWRQS